MAWHGGRGAEIRTDESQIAQNIINEDEYDSQYGMSPARREAMRDAISDIVEIDRAPEAVDSIVNSMDGDARLMRELLCERHPGFNNIMYQINHNLLVRNLVRRGLANLPPATLAMINPRWRRTIDAVAIATAGVAKAVVVGTTTRAVLASVFGVGVVPASAIAGGVSGFVMGYRRAKDRNESASSWMSELSRSSLLSERHGDRSDERILNVDMMSDDELVRALGILSNAIKERRVRGNSQTKMELAVKYRMIRGELKKRRNEQREQNPENMSPILRELNDAIASADEEGQLISDFAAERYREDYEKIIELKKQIERRTIIKSVISGVAIGGTMGLISELGGIGKTIHAIRDFFHIQSGEEILAAKQEVVGQALQAKADALQASSPSLGQEIALHQGHESVFQQFMNGELSVDQMTPDQTASVLHNVNLGEAVIQGNHASLSGLHPGEIAQFDSLLHDSAPLRSMYEFAGSHNLDMSYVLHNGEQFGQFLAQHQAEFTSMPPDIQSFILSHPSVAEEMFKAGQEAGAEATKDIWMAIATKVLAAGTVLAAGGVFAGASIQQAGLRKDIDKTYKDLEREGGATQSAYRTETEQGNKAKSIQEILDSQWVRFLDISTKRYKIFGIDPNGTVHLRDFEKPTAVLPPNIRNLNINNYLEPELNTINRTILQVQKTDTVPVAKSPELFEEESEKLKKLIGMSGVTGTIKTVGGIKMVQLNEPPAAKKIGSVAISTSSPRRELPDGIQFNLAVTSAEIVAGKPVVDFDASYSAAGETYNFNQFHKEKTSKIELNTAIKTLISAGEANKILIYMGTASGFLQPVSFDPGRKEYMMRKYNPTTGLFGPPFAIPDSRILTINSYSFTRT